MRGRCVDSGLRLKVEPTGLPAGEKGNSGLLLVLELRKSKEG